MLYYKRSDVKRCTWLYLYRSITLLYRYIRNDFRVNVWVRDGNALACRLSRVSAYRCLHNIARTYNCYSRPTSSIYDYGTFDIVFPTLPRNHLYKYCLDGNLHECLDKPRCHRREVLMLCLHLPGSRRTRL